MPALQPRYPKEEFARRGTEIYDRDIRLKVEADHKGEFLAIDIETGDYEMAETTMKAAQSLFSRRPEAQIWYVRIGSPYVYHIGGGLHQK